MSTNLNLRKGDEILKLKLCWVSLAIACLLIPLSAGAATVFETTGWIIGETGTGLTFDFEADTAPYTYRATLSDLNTDPFGLKLIFLSITTATVANPAYSIFGPGSFTFAASPGETHFANVFGIGGGELKAGLFGIDIQTVPIPPSLILLGSSLIGLVFLRRRVR
jgi:hypothetical protein